VIKYLYGKRCYLDRFAKTGKGLWFRDLYTMDKLSNEDISDDEECKSIKVASEEISSISIAGRDFRLAPNTHFNVSITPPRCHVLCLSDKENCPELFKLFEADICIAINVVKMVKMIQGANNHIGLEVVADNIKYYRDSTELLDCKPEKAAFLKSAESYHIESEYRIAVFWPNGESSRINTVETGHINVFGDITAQDDHITFNFQCPEFSQIVVGVKRI
jgi:hypothetical protein